MNFNIYNPQVQDTITTPSINLSPVSTGQKGLVIERKSIELGNIVQRLAVDSTRIAKPKKVRPIVKTIPYIPENDSIDHPSYNSLTGKYELNKTNDFQDNFNYEWIKPIAKVSITKTTDTKNTETINKALLKQTIIKLEKQNNQDVKPQGFNNTDWMLGIIIFILILFGWIKVAYGRYIQVVIQASYNYFAARKIQEEGNVLRKQVFNIMNVLFFVVIALFSAQYLSFYHYSIFNLPGILVFLISLAFWLILYSFKALALAILDFIFLAKGAFMSYNTTVFIYNKLLSFILIPIISCIPFVPINITPILLNIGIIAFSLLYVMRLFRGLQTGIKNRLSIFYLILYLCALEILPLLVILKLIFSFN